MKAVRKHVKEPWIILYIDRWMKALFSKDGALRKNSWSLVGRSHQPNSGIDFLQIRQNQLDVLIADVAQQKILCKRNSTKSRMAL